VIVKQTFRADIIALSEPVILSLLLTSDLYAHEASLMSR